MKAILYRQCGGPEVLSLEDLPDPVLGAGEVLIAVELISIEGGDLLHRKSTALTGPYRVPGYQALGRVIGWGEGVSGLSQGQRVLAFHWEGSHAEKWSVQAKHVFALPDGIEPEMAATLATTFGTASDALFEFGQAQPGETVLVPGGAGGVGLALVQLAAAAGARVIASASGPERAERLRDFGAAEVIDHAGGANLTARCLELTGGTGVDMVCDLAGGERAAELLAALRYRGRYMVVGSASGSRASFTFGQIVPRALRVQGVLFGAEMGSARGRKVVQDQINALAAGKIRMPIDRIFPLAEAVAAHHHCETAHPFGRVLLRV